MFDVIVVLIEDVVHYIKKWKEKKEDTLTKTDKTVTAVDKDNSK